jgi:hypothetical protein
MRIPELLDAAKAGAGIQSDYRLAQILGIKNSAVANWRAEHARPSDEHILRLADMAQLDQAEALAQAQIEKAKTPAERAAWVTIAERVSRAVAGLAVVVIMSGGLMAESRAESTTYNGAPAAGRSIHCRGSLRQLGAAVLRWTCQMLQVLCTRSRPTLAAC